MPEIVARDRALADYPVGMQVEWEASPYGSRFIGVVAEHGTYCGKDAARIDGRPSGWTYPDHILREVPDLMANLEASLKERIG